MTRFTRLLSTLTFFALVAALAVGCVKRSEYDALQAKYDASQTALAECEGEYETCATNYALEQERSAELEGQLTSIMAEKGALETSVEDMQAALAAYKAREAAAQARMEEYRSLLAKFQEMVDAGKLKVKIRDGRMVVELASDVLFDSGKADLSENGQLSIQEVTAVLASIDKRKFQIEGHTDNKPISTARFPSNWELASARALTVVDVMIQNGMPRDRVSAASFADTLPVASNETDEGRAQNRRIEIVLIPDLSQLPGFDQLNKLNTES